MAYAVKYRLQYENQNNELLELRILKDGYLGSVNDIDNVKELFNINYEDSDGGNNVVLGSSLEAGFIADERTTYSDLLTANYREFQAKLYKDGALKWSGWLINDNTSTQFYNNKYNFSLSFNDGLAELDRLDITPQSGQNSLMHYIKEAVKNTGFELDFKVVLNTRNPLILSTECPLLLSELPSDRFNKVDGGKKTWFNSKETIETILKVFNCKLFQSEGVYKIVNELEINTSGFNIAFSNLAVTSTFTNNNEIDLSSKKVERNSTLTLVRPYKTAQTTFENKFIPVNLITNGDFTGVTNIWSLTGDTTGETLFINDPDNALEVQNTGSTNTEIITNDIAIESKSNEDKLRLSIDLFLEVYNNTEPQLSLPLKFTAYLVAPDGGEEVFFIGSLIEGGRKNFQGDFFFNQTGNYKIKIVDDFGQRVENTSITWQIENISAFPIFGGEEGSVNFDKNFIATNTNNSAIDNFGKDEDVIKIGDSIEDNAVGSIRVGSNLTSEWSTSGNSEGTDIQYLYLINKLRKRTNYNEKVAVNFLGDFSNIEFDNIIIINYKKYIIRKYTKEYSTIFNYYRLELEEYRNDSITYIIDSFTLSTVEGKDESQSVGFNETDPIFTNSAAANITQSLIDSWNAKVDRWETWDSNLLVNGKAEASNFIFTGTGAGGSLPIATNSILGLVKIGAGLSVDGNGLLTANNQGTVQNWGDIGGTLSNQNDLQNALNSKADSSALNNYVTLATSQTITGSKVFSANTSIKNNTNPNIGFRNADGSGGGYTGYITSLAEVRLYNYTGLNGITAKDNGVTHVQGNGSFAVGTDTPDSNAKLHTVTTSTSWGLMTNTSNKINFSGLYFDGDNSNLILRDANGTIRTRLRANTASYFLNNLAIGKQTASYPLEVNGDVGINGNIAILAGGAITSNSSALSFLNSGSALPINTNELLVSNSYSHRSEVPTNGIFSKGDIKTTGNLVFSGPLSAGNQITDFQQGYSLWSDNTGDGQNGSTTRLWFNAPNKGSFVFGSRSGASYLDSIRMRSRRVQIESDEASTIVIDTGIITATNFVFGS